MRAALLAYILEIAVLVSGLQAQEPTFELAWGSSGRTEGHFETITGVHVTTDGVVWVADLYAVQSFDSRGVLQTRSNLTGPSDVTVAGNDTLFVSDRFGDVVYRLAPDGAMLDYTNLCPETHQCPLSFRTIASDSRGFLYVGTPRFQQVWRLTLSLEHVSSWGGFVSPDGIAINGQDQIFVSDSQRHQVKKLDPEGTLLLSWGEYGGGPGQFKSPRGLAVDSQGVVYVADHDNHRIQAFDSLGVHLFSWGSQGSGPGEFQGPSAIDVGRDGTIYVGDAGNYRIQKFSRPVAVNGRSWGAVKDRYR